MSESEASHLLSKKKQVQVETVSAADSIMPEDVDEAYWRRQDLLLHKEAHWTKRPSLWAIAIPICLFSTCQMATAPVAIVLLLESICRSISSGGVADPLNCDDDKTQAIFSSLQACTTFFVAMISVFLSAKLGQLSDIHGRRKLLCFNMACMVFAHSMASILYNPKYFNFHFKWFVFVDCIGALSGGTATFLALCVSYVIDITEEEDRLNALGLLTAAYQVGVSLGPMIGGFVNKHIGSGVKTLYIIISMELAIWLYFVFLLPESRSHRSRAKSRDDSERAREERRQLALELQRKHTIWEELGHTVKGFFEPLKVLWLPVEQEDGSRDYGPRVSLLLIQALDVAFAFCKYELFATALFYATYMFHWDASGLGNALSLFGASEGLVLAVVLPLVLKVLNRYFEAKSFAVDVIDLIVVRGSIVSYAIAFSVLVMSGNTLQFMIGIVMASFSAMMKPTMKAMAVKFVPPESTGKLMGAISAVESLSNTLGSPLMYFVYSSTVSTHPRTIFLVASIGIVVAFIITFVFMGNKRLNRALLRTNV